VIPMVGGVYPLPGRGFWNVFCIVGRNLKHSYNAVCGEPVLVLAKETLVRSIDGEEFCAFLLFCDGRTGWILGGWHESDWWNEF